MVEILKYARDNEEYRNLADRILSIALSGRIKESQMVRAVVQIKKRGKAEKVIQFINDVIIWHSALRSWRRGSHPGWIWQKNVSTQQETERVFQKPKQEVWNMCRQYLSDAEKYLNDVLNYTYDPNETFFIK